MEQARRVFLGGTCNGSLWRDAVIPLLKIDYFNPVVENWTPADLENELKERERCSDYLYVITPRMEGFYSIAELVDDSNKRPEKTLCCFLTDDEGKHFSFTQWRSIKAIKEMLIRNGVQVFETIDEVIRFLNTARV
ncbi:MAG TPA: nucleoside 2-deoxyribosyltransferase domain-containing protein [Chitinophagaceae bacterium]|nr:nucleoside 2-deoxyribosyltransferase domain-containing protein [Chitinophagaceae bacterium]